MITLRQKMIEEMDLHGYAMQTKRNYLASVLYLVRFAKATPGKITQEQIKQFLRFKQRAGLAPSSLRNLFAGIRFFFHHVLQKPLIVQNIPSIKREQKLPNVLSVSEVKKLISCACDLKTKALIMCLYATGMRLFELANLKCSDIDSDRMVIKVLGKGNKERYVSLSEKLLLQLREYWLEYKPRTFLFEGKTPGKPYHRRSLQLKFEIAKKTAKIIKSGGVHMLRHSFATHLLEAGVPLVVIQKLLGHARIETTTKYTWIANSTVSSIKSPLDLIIIPKSNKEVNNG